ncbi:MAG: hypothetical protein K1X47_16785 [Cyclobacteriaceae bacterium]|nr:hypothetical protein [Cyclobacteriaceae bacterium]
MSQVQTACLQILSQLNQVVSEVTQEDFARPSVALGGTTFGQHLRHTLEFFICLEKGLPAGVVNYDKRAHDHQLESHRSVALATIDRIRAFVAADRTDRPLKLELCYAYEGGATSTLQTNYQRELAYNIEHAVHHMALMKIALRELAPYVTIPEYFGIASSTIRYNAATVASS